MFFYLQNNIIAKSSCPIILIVKTTMSVFKAQLPPSMSFECIIILPRASTWAKPSGECAPHISPTLVEQL